MKAFLLGVQPDGVEIVMEGDELIVRGSCHIAEVGIRYINQGLMMVRLSAICTSMWNNAETNI